MFHTHHASPQDQKPKKTQDGHQQALTHNTLLRGARQHTRWLSLGTYPQCLSLSLPVGVYPQFLAPGSNTDLQFFAPAAAHGFITHRLNPSLGSTSPSPPSPSRPR